MSTKDMQFTVNVNMSHPYIGVYSYLPHKAVYRTFTIISLGSLIFGIGRSSIATWSGPLKMTAFIVSLPMVSWTENELRILCLTIFCFLCSRRFDQEVKTVELDELFGRKR